MPDITAFPFFKVSANISIKHWDSTMDCSVSSIALAVHYTCQRYPKLVASVTADNMHIKAFIKLIFFFLFFFLQPFHHFERKEVCSNMNPTNIVIQKNIHLNSN
jgi:hypothetical protein